MVLTTTDGATLFDTVPRSVTFNPRLAYAAGVSGNAVYIDGVPLRAGSGGNTSASGSIAAKLQLRDDIAVDMQRQLDEVARGVITAFAETDPSGTLADATGLFTWSGSPAIPGPGTVVDGIAGSISINAAMDSTIGGNPELLRDGGANGAAYKHNVTNAASFSDLLLGYADKLDQPIAFDAASGVAGTKSDSDYAAASIGWLGSMRQDAAQGSESKDALATRTSSALSNATGVNMDEEMSLLLELEHSYQASARLISTVDSMLAALLQAAG
jgi:flagellar hook-associated protein 1 FlgK